MLDLHQASCESQKWQGSLHGLQESLSWAQQHWQHGSTEEKGGIRTLKDMPHCTKNNIPFLRDYRNMDMQEWMKEAKQGTYLLGSRLHHLRVSKNRSYAMLSSGKILPNVWSYSRTTSCKPRLTSPKSSIFHQLSPRLKLNRRRGNPKEELRIGIIPTKNTRLFQMSKRRN